MPLPTRPPEWGMIRSPLVRMAATTATLVPCHRSFRFPSLEWAWNRSPWVGRRTRGITIQSQERPGLGQGRGLGHSHLGSTGLAEAWWNAGSVVKLTS